MRHFSTIVFSNMSPILCYFFEMCRTVAFLQFYYDFLTFQVPQLTIDRITSMNSATTVECILLAYLFSNMYKSVCLLFEVGGCVNRTS